MSAPAIGYQSAGSGPSAVRRSRRRLLTALAALAVAGLLSLPVLGVLESFLEPGGDSWSRVLEQNLPQFIGNTFRLAFFTGLGVLFGGVATAWLVTMCRFPGRRWFEWLLILPLAAPAYIIAYVYTDFLQHSGAVQSLFRDVTGLGPRDYWFPNIRSLEGAVVVFTLVLYPYVYLLTRAAFLEQSICVLEASRTLGRSAWASFWKVALPLARPAIATGTALALMEALADFGTVAHFGVPTFTTGIYRAWFDMSDPVSAGRLASLLLLFVAVLMWLERHQRGVAKYHETTNVVRDLPRFRLRGWKAAAAFVICAVPVTFGFLLPVGLMLHLHAINEHEIFSPRYLTLLGNTFTLGSIAAVVAVSVSLFLAYSLRRMPIWPTRLATRIASLGYAVPGSVIAVGILIPLAGFDNALDRWLRAEFGVSSGLLFTGTIAALIFAYVVRFLAVSLNTVEASFGKISRSMDDAAVTLGAGATRTFGRVLLPLMRGSVLTALLLVFVDVMKELPATLIMRPFNYDTLAVQAYRLASDERLAEAATPSLMIVGAGLLPVILLSRTIMRSRRGGRGH